MLADQLSKRDDVEALLLIDKEPETSLTRDTEQGAKIAFIQDNLGNDERESDWMTRVRKFEPTVTSTPHGRSGTCMAT
jgi:hypothetical protein